MKLAIVTPWFAAEPGGGAERLAYELATGLQARKHDVSVLTTTSRSFSDPWNRDSFVSGDSVVRDVRVTRFRVNRTNAQRFFNVNRKLLAVARERLRPGVPLLDADERDVFVDQNIGSKDLLAHLAANADAYDAILFLPYLYGTTLQGWQCIPQRAVIVPCLHDEAYAYIKPVANMMRGAAMLLFNSQGAYETARHLYGPGIIPRSHIVGEGIAALAASTNDRSPIAGFVPEDERYVLYLGRLAREKNLDLLIDAYRRFIQLDPLRSLRLVLAGEPAGFAYEAHPGIVELGYVDEAQKSRLLHSARALMQPSFNESFSRAMVEAWQAGRPVAVNQNCKATSMALERTGAGWRASDVIEWQTLLRYIDDASDATLASTGERATAFVREEAAWPVVLDRYEHALEALATKLKPAPKQGGPRIVQILDAVEYGTSLTNIAIATAAALRAADYPSTIESASIDTRLRALARPLTPAQDGDIRIAYNGGPPPVPIFVDLNAWNTEPDVTLMNALADGRTNILALAPVSESGRQLELLDVFGHYLTFDFQARFLLVGPLRDASYAAQVRERIERMGLEHRILLTDAVSQPALAACYRSAHLAVDLRERHTTGLGLLEAMAFDVPVCVAASADTNRIVEDAGVVINGDMPPLTQAGLWRVMIADADVRSRVIASQRARLERMGPEHTLQAIRTLIDRAHG